MNFHENRGLFLDGVSGSNKLTWLYIFPYKKMFTKDITFSGLSVTLLDDGVGKHFHNM